MKLNRKFKTIYFPVTGRIGIKTIKINELNHFWLFSEPEVVGNFPANAEATGSTKIPI
jgi:hypothetical protein